MITRHTYNLLAFYGIHSLLIINIIAHLSLGYSIRKTSNKEYYNEWHKSSMILWVLSLATTISITKYFYVSIITIEIMRFTALSIAGIAILLLILNYRRIFHGNEKS